MDYIYGKLNKLVDVTASKILSNDESISLSKLGSTTYLEINKHKLVELRKLSDKLPILYLLLGYNTDTQRFDIPLGDKITLTGDSSGGVAINSVKIGDQPIDAYVNEEGQLIMESIPIAALKNSDYYYKPDGSIEYYESVIDGNA